MGRKLGSKNIRPCDETNRIIDYISKSIAKSGISMAELSERSGVAYHAIWQTTHRISMPSADILVRLVLALGYDIDIKKRK